MKPLLYLSLIALLSCNRHYKPATQDVATNLSVDTSVSVNKIDDSKYYTTLDTVIIATEIGDTMRYSKAKYNAMIDKHPEFFEGIVSHPDILYNNNKDVEFASEVGHDAYCVTYAYFLKQRNGINPFAEQRKRFIDIYLKINSLFGHLQYDGTYFGHQRHRILAYAEYSVNIIADIKIEKTYDISKQKALYIKSLRQLIDDESKIDFETMGKEKIKRTKELNKIVDELDKLITSIVYLRRAQEFQYEYYEYH